jgi:hypothetical protein
MCSGATMHLYSGDTEAMCVLSFWILRMVINLSIMTNMVDREIAELQQNNITRNDHGLQCLAALPLLQIHGGFILKQKHTDKLQHALHFRSC